MDIASSERIAKILLLTFGLSGRLGQHFTHRLDLLAQDVSNTAVLLLFILEWTSVMVLG